MDFLIGLGFYLLATAIVFGIFLILPPSAGSVGHDEAAAPASHGGHH